MVELSAVLWDMDGTLVDTEPYWFSVEKELIESHGGTWTRADAEHLVGNDLLTSGRYIRERGGVDLPPEGIVELLVQSVFELTRGEVPWRPGARELLDVLHDAGIPCALVSSSYERLVTAVVDALPAGRFAAVVPGDEVTNGKPHPEPYLQAARLLGVEPERCLAIEDSDTGATSAESAGCHVLVVENHVRVPRSRGRSFLPTLEGLRLEDLESLMAG